MSQGYDYVVMDNEAGMEHISRRTTRDVDHLVLVTDTSQRGVTAARRIAEMIPGLEVNIANTYIVVNRVTGDQMPAPLAAAVEATGAKLLGTIPSDDQMTEFEFGGRPLVELPVESPVVQSVYQIAEQIMTNGRD
jgi:CO dehydrogenase maturation factor